MKKFKVGDKIILSETVLSLLKGLDSNIGVIAESRPICDHDKYEITVSVKGKKHNYFNVKENYLEIAYPPEVLESPLYKLLQEEDEV